MVAFWWRNRRVVSVCSSQAFKDAENLINRSTVVIGPASYHLNGPKSIVTLQNNEWKEKSKCLFGTIRGNNLESFVDDFYRIAKEAVTTWTPRQIQLKKEMFRMTMKAVLSTLFGNIFEDESSIEKLIGLYDHCKLEADRHVLDDTPLDKKGESDFQENLTKLQDCLKQILDSRKAQRQGNIPFLDTLLESGYAEDDILSQMLSFLGGFHTSGYYATWLFHLLAQHPHVQDKLFAEIKDRVGENTADGLRAYALTSSSYLRQVVDEALRVSSTSPFIPYFTGSSSMMVDGYPIPANTHIICAVGVAMHDSKVWDNPDVFDPDRFAPGSKHAKRGHEFRPFGVSLKRRCPANLFVYVMISVFVAILVRHFKFSLTDSQIEVEKKYGVVTGQKGNVYIQVDRRMNDNDTTT